MLGQQHEKPREISEVQKSILKSKIRDMMHKEGLTIEDVIEVVIDENRLIGVGKISLGEYLDSYCQNYYTKHGSS